MAADVAETNWKHKDTPDQGDLMTLKVKVNDPHFQYRLSVSQDACLVQIWLFQPKPVLTYHVD